MASENISYHISCTVYGLFRLAYLS